jgi:hypothetical protein
MLAAETQSSAEPHTECCQYLYLSSMPQLTLMSVLRPHHQGVTVSDLVDSSLSTWAGRSVWLEASRAVSSRLA